MPQLRLDLLEAFIFRSPDERPHWKKRFQQFRLASGLSEDGNTKQVSTLLYMEQDAEDASIHVQTFPPRIASSMTEF